MSYKKLIIILLIIVAAICSVPTTVAGIWLFGPRVQATLGVAPTPTPDIMGTSEQAIEFVKRWTPEGKYTVPIGESIAFSENDKTSGIKTIGWSATKLDDIWQVQWHRTLRGEPMYSTWLYNPRDQVVIPFYKAW